MIKDRSGGPSTASRGNAKRHEAELLAERAPGLLARLQVLTGALAGALSERDVARVLVDIGVDALGAAAGVVVLDTGDGSLTIIASKGYPDELMERWHQIPADAPVPIADSIRSREPVYILSLEERDRLYPSLAKEDAANRAFLVVPIVLEDRALGALALSFAEPKALLDVDRAFMLAIAQQAAVSLERARLYDAERRARGEAERAILRQQFLARATEVLSSTLELNDILAQLARVAVPALADWCVVYLADRRGGVRRAALARVDPERGALVDEIRTSFSSATRGGGVLHVLRTGEVAFHPTATAAMLAADADDPEGLATMLEPAGISSWICVPIAHAGEILGAISFVGAGGREYSLADVQLAEDVAAGAGLAIDNARLMAGERAARAQAEKVRDRLSFLSEVSGVLAKSLDHRDAIAELGALAAGRIADWCAIDLVSEHGTIERIVARHADPVAMTPVEEESVDWPIDPDLPVGSPAVIRSGRPELYAEIDATTADHISQDPTELEILRTIGITSALIVPITARGRTFGALTLVSTREDRRYDPEDLDFAMLVALRAGVATDNARLFTEARRSEESSRFQRLLLESQSEATIDGIRVVSADGRILFVNRRWREMWGIADDVDLIGVAEDELLRGVLDLIEDPEPFLQRVRWLYENPEESARDEVRLKDGRVWDRWSAPLITEGVTYGRAWFQRDVTAERQLEERLVAAERRSSFLADISEVLAAERDERALFEELAAKLVPFLADWCIVDIAQKDGTYDRVAVAHQDPSRVEIASRIAVRRHYTVDPDAGRGVPKVLRTGVTDWAPSIPDTWIDELGAEDPDYIDVLRSLGFRSYIVVPLRARGRVLGAVTLVTAESGRTFEEDHVTLAEDIARRASIAIENVRLLAERSATARSLQESLLPPMLPMIPGVSLAARYRAAGEGNEVGGDFYDVFPAVSGGWALVVGDVCGKGPEAAALTALVRYTIRTLSMQIRKPRRILARLNDAILSQRSDGRFCTLAYGRIDVDEAGVVSLRLSSGGHPLPILIRRNGEVRVIGRTGTLLGVFPDARSPETSVTLEPGDAIVFYTDGVTEARDGDAALGESGLLKVLRECGGADASAIAQKVDHAVRDFQTGEQRDDIAVVVVQAVPSAS